MTIAPSDLTLCWRCGGAGPTCETHRAQYEAAKLRESEEAAARDAALKAQEDAWHAEDMRAVAETEEVEREHDDTCLHCSDLSGLERAERRRLCRVRESWTLPREAAVEMVAMAEAAFTPWRAR